MATVVAVAKEVVSNCTSPATWILPLIGVAWACWLNTAKLSRPVAKIANTDFIEFLMISHLNANFFAIAARSVDSLTSLRTTNVPTAPMLTTSNFANCFAINAGWHRFAVPTLTARRKTTEGTSRR